MSMRVASVGSVIFEPLSNQIPGLTKEGSVNAVPVMLVKSVYAEWGSLYLYDENKKISSPIKFAQLKQIIKSSPKDYLIVGNVSGLESDMERCANRMKSLSIEMADLKK